MPIFVQSNIIAFYFMNIKRFSFAAMAMVLAFAAQAADWMASIDNKAYVNQVSIPGSHDSATAHGWTGFFGSLSGSSSATTQGKTLQEQWDCGIRAFDLRPGYVGGSLEIFHGVCQTKLSLAGALDIICEKLDSHPTEFAVILTRHESDGDGKTADWAGAMAELLQKEPYASHIVAYDPKLTVEQLRGKMVILTRDEFPSDKVGLISGWSHSSVLADQKKGTVKCGDASGRIFAQDFYDCTAAGADATKIEAVKAMNDYAAKLCDYESRLRTWVVNHTSGYTKSASSDGNRDLASKANTALLEELTTPGSKAAPTGIVMMDFAGEQTSKDYTTNGQALIDAIIAQNQGYEMLKNQQDAINEIEADAPAAANTYFDLQGRPVASPLPGHVYISSRGHKILAR